MGSGRAKDHGEHREWRTLHPADRPVLELEFGAPQLQHVQPGLHNQNVSDLSADPSLPISSENADPLPACPGGRLLRLHYLRLLFLGRPPEEVQIHREHAGVLLRAEFRSLLRLLCEQEQR